jgi:hypothetical protein
VRTVRAVGAERLRFVETPRAERFGGMLEARVAKMRGSTLPISHPTNGRTPGL